MPFGRDGLYVNDFVHPVICDGCGNKFNINFIPRSGGKVYYRSCMSSMNRFSDAELELINEELNLEATDVQIGKQLHDLLTEIKAGKPPKNEFVVKELIDKLVSDDKRRKTILDELKSIENNRHKS